MPLSQSGLESDSSRDRCTIRGMPVRLDFHISINGFHIPPGIQNFFPIEKILDRFSALISSFLFTNGFKSTGDLPMYDC